MAPPEQELRLPEYFPLAPKPCATKATAFFDCFTAAGAQAPETPVRRQRRQFFVTRAFPRE